MARQDSTPQTEPPGEDPVATALGDPDSADAQSIRRAVGTFAAPLCLRCVGRFASRLDRTRDNPSIGQTVAAALDIRAIETDSPECPWCEGVFTETNHLADLVCRASAPYDFDTMILGAKIHPDIQRIEAHAADALTETAREWYEPMKTELNRAVGAVALGRLGKQVDFDRADIVVMYDPYFDQTEVEPASLYLHATYQKFDRTIPQTQWPCNRCRGAGCTRCKQTGQQYGTSVQALIDHVAKDAFDAPEAAFHGGGREDIDALMLGTGRPFVMELKRPRLRQPRAPHETQAAKRETEPTPAPPAQRIALSELEAMINEYAAPRAQIGGLRWSSKQEVVAVKDAALDKAYRAHIETEAAVSLVALEAAIGTITSAAIKQRTPTRVAHRRADKIRDRMIHSVEVASFGRHARARFEIQANPELQDHDEPDEAPAQATAFTLDITAQSGTYIKELISGDDGRTSPALAGLLKVSARVVALDVVGMTQPHRADQGPRTAQLAHKGT